MSPTLESAGRTRRIFEAAATLCGFTALAVVWTWPLAADPGGRFVSVNADPGALARADAQLVSWILAWVAHGVRTAPLALFDGNAFHPLQGTLALSEHMIGSAPVVLPVDVLWGNAVLDHNVLLLATFAIGGAATAGLVRELGGSWAAAVTAGVIAFFGPHRLALLAHVPSLSLQWLPLALIALHRTLRTGSRGAACALTVLLILHAASSVYLAYYAALALVVLVALCALLRCPAAPGGYRRVFTAALVAGMVMVPLMLPYAAARDVYVLERDPGEAFMMSARGITYVGAVLDPIRHLRQRFLESGWPEAMVGLGTLALAFVGLWRGGGARLGGRRLTGAYLGVALVMALLSLGPRMQLRPAADGGLPGLHLLLAGVVPGFEALRVPVRATAVAVLMLAVLAGFGVDALLARVRWRAAALWVLGGVLVFEIWHPMLHVVPVRWVSAAPPAWQSWIEQQPGREPIVQLPLGSPAGDARAMVLSTRHWRPLVNGYSGFLPAGYYLRRVLASFPDERSQTLLRGLDVRYVVAAGRTAACTRLEASPQAGMRIAFRAPAACVIELSGAVPAAAEPGVSLPVARLVSSDGEELALDTAGTLVREWSQAVEPTTSGWLRIDLEAPAQVQAVVLRLGRRFGLYLRQYRVETSLDGRTWRTVRDEVVGEAPLVAYQRDPEDLWVRIDVTPTEARHLRLLRTADRGEGAFDLWAGWQAWGLAGIEVLGTP